MYENATWKNCFRKQHPNNLAPLLNHVLRFPWQAFWQSLIETSSYIKLFKPCGSLRLYSLLFIVGKLDTCLLLCVDFFFFFHCSFLVRNMNSLWATPEIVLSGMTRSHPVPFKKGTKCAGGSNSSSKANHLFHTPIRLLNSLIYCWK